MKKNEVLMKKLEEKRFFEFVKKLEKLGLIVEVYEKPEWYTGKCWSYQPGKEEK